MRRRVIVLLVVVALLVVLALLAAGDETPSQEDIAIAHRLKHAGELLGMPVLDHLGLGATTFHSMKERGLL